VTDRPSAAGVSDHLEAELRERVSPFASRYVGLGVGMRVGDGVATVGFGRTGRGGTVPDGRCGVSSALVTVRPWHPKEPL
jgi:hypothetical protein